MAIIIQDTLFDSSLINQSLFLSKYQFYQQKFRKNNTEVMIMPILLEKASYFKSQNCWYQN
jgi:hypothetical protein